MAAAVADKARVKMLCTLMDGRAYTATELSLAAEVAPSTASSHLARLLEQRLIDCLPQGRHRYFRLAGPQVAEALETMMGLAGADRAVIRSRTPPALRFARTCYDHMAGELAVTLHDRLFELGWFDEGRYRLSEAGQCQLERLGIDHHARTTRRRFACACLDWSERRVHLGGQLGATLLLTFERKDWLRRRLDSRELALTDKGHQALGKHFNLEFR
ncbi:ArsR/SmtB family transcription factor [Zobellella sp. DQSA1]|uniref:ArsR/SmtB family transcription factor n=1 Tax=Zobellella sp. DQSA1 TaxID=3342386 RepID=UPI0035C26334